MSVRNDVARKNLADETNSTEKYPPGLSEGWMVKVVLIVCKSPSPSFFTEAQNNQTFFRERATNFVLCFVTFSEQKAKFSFALQHQVQEWLSKFCCFTNGNTSKGKRGPVNPGRSRSGQEGAITKRAGGPTSTFYHTIQTKMHLQRKCGGKYSFTCMPGED